MKNYNKIISIFLFLFLLTVSNGFSRDTLHLIHLADSEASVPTLETAPNFAALVDEFVNQGESLRLSTLILSSGDNYLPGPFMSASGDRSMRDIFREATGNQSMREGNGRADIQIHNILGVEASAIGNHEFDLGTDFFAGLMEGDIRPGDPRDLGCEFPYLSANLDFSNDGKLSQLYTTDLLKNTDFRTVDIDNPVEKKMAPYTIIEKDNKKYGIVGATTPIVESISSTGGVVAKEPGGRTNNMESLASILQPYVDTLTNEGCEIIILLTHMQQLSLEMELISYLNNVDIIIGGGSNSILADDNDSLFEGDIKVDTYPIKTKNKNGDPALIVNTDGGMKYVGRLYVEFDDSGIVDLSSLNEDISGAWKADSNTVKQFHSDYNDAFEDVNSRAYKVKLITDGLSSVIASKDGNTFGYTNVFLEGRRSSVRTGETNLGNLTADANLWYAKTIDSNVKVSLKNGGGIRAEIGNVTASGVDNFKLIPPIANPIAGKEYGEISQLDIENSMRFNNGLTLFSLTAEQLLEVLNHGVASSGPGATPGQFSQVGGIRFTYDTLRAPGLRVREAWIIDEIGNDIEKIAENGEVIGDPNREIRCVSLGFLVAGGDGYPYPEYKSENESFFNEVDLVAEIQTGQATYANDGTEQDALSEYLALNHNSKLTAFNKKNEGRINLIKPSTKLHLIHLADAEASVPALSTAPNFAALVDKFVKDGDDLGIETLILSSGDNYLPGPFMSGAGDGSMREVFRNATGNPYMREGNGRGDIVIHNILGVQASAIGNHEFDLGTSFFADVIATDIRSEGEARYFGANFPYLSSNLDFSADGNLSDLVTDEVLLNRNFENGFYNINNPSQNEIAKSTIIRQPDGSTYGIIGATTPIVESISSTGDVVASEPGGGTNNMEQLASIINDEVNRLKDKGIDKIILLAHMQQISLEQELIGYLKEVDVVIAGGSNTILADENDRLKVGDVAADTYPIVTKNLDGNTALIVNTDGGYNYLGRLLVEFDSEGNIIENSIDSDISGAWITDDQMLEEQFGSIDNAFSDSSSRAAKVKTITDGIQQVIIDKDGNTFGWTDVFLEGRRSEVRTKETNLGNLTAEANLWYAKTIDNTVEVSLKNGGGIRAEIGNILASGVSNFELVPPVANQLAGKEAGQISQLDIENSMRFNNALTLVTLTAEQLVKTIEHAISASTEGATPGQFPQIAGLRFSWNPNFTAGSRIVDAFIVDENSEISSTLVSNGELQGDPNRSIRVVTLNFLVDGGDSYPYPDFKSENEGFFNEVELNEEGVFSGQATFAEDGTEQDALAEYLITFHKDKNNAWDMIRDYRILDVTTTSVDEEGNSSLEVIAYPNPSTGIVNFRFYLPSIQKVDIKLSNALGQTIAQYDLGTLESGLNNHQIDFRDFISGRYYISISGKSFDTTSVINISK